MTASLSNYLMKLKQMRRCLYLQSASCKMSTIIIKPALQINGWEMTLKVIYFHSSVSIDVRNIIMTRNLVGQITDIKPPPNN